MNETEILFNKYKNLPTAFPNETFLANQAVGDAFPTIIPITQIWSSTIPATAPTALGSVVSFTNGSYQQSTAYPWIRKYTLTMDIIQSPVQSFWYASTDVNDPINTNICRDTIPFNFDPLGSYTIQVFANGTPVSPTYTDYPWNYDDAAGILTFYPLSLSVLPPTPITMVLWRYVGNKGGSALSYWNITDPPSGTNLNFDYLGTTKAVINSSGNITANNNLITNNLLQIVDPITTPYTWDIGSSNGTMYFNYPTAIVDIIQLKPAGSLQLNGSAPSFRVLDRTNSAHWIGWYSINDGTLTWEYWNGTTMTNFMTFTNSNSTLNVPVIKPTNITDISSSNGTTGQYLTKASGGISWSTLPTIGDGTLTITNGTFMTGSGTFTANQSGNTSITIGTNATSANTASTIVARDATNNFSAGAITATSIIPTQITDTTASNGTTGQYLTKASGGIAWGTLPTIGNGTLTITNGTFMTGSGTFTANQSGNTSITIGTNATSANTASTIVARDATNNFSAGTITANLTGTASISSRANTIDTTTASALTYYLPMVDTGTGSTSEIVYVDTGLSYAAGTNTLTASTFNGGANYINTNTMIGSIFYPIFVNTSGNTANQIPWTNINFNYTNSTSTLAVPNIACGVQLTIGGTQVISASASRTSFTGGNGISVASGISVGTAYSGSGVVGLSMICNAGATDVIAIYDSTITTLLFQINGTRITTTLPITAPSFIGSLTGSATLIDTTQQTTGTYYLTLAPLTTSQPNGQTLYTGIVSYQYLSGTNGVMINRGSYRMLDRSNATSFFWDIFTTTGNALTFDYNSGIRQITISTAGVLGGLVGISRLTNPLYIGNTDGYVSAGISVPLAMLQNTIANGTYNNIQLGHSSANYNSWFMGARYNTGASSTIFSLAPYGVGQTDCWYVDGDGNTQQAGTMTSLNATITYLTIPQGNILIYDQTDGTKYWTISSSSGNLYFNQTTSPFAIPLSINYDGGGVLTYNQRNYAYSPTGLGIEMDSSLTLEGISGLTTTSVSNNANDFAGFVSITNPTSVASGALATFSIQSVNPSNRTIKLSTPVNVSGTLTGTIAGVNRIYVNMTAITITMTRNGTSFTNFAYDKPTLPLQFDYSFSTTAARPFTQPFFQLNLTLSPTDVAIVDGIPTYDVYVVKMVATLTYTLISGGGTFTGAYGGAGFTLNLNTAHTGTGITFNTADAAVSALSMVKSGLINKPCMTPYYLTSNYTNLVYQRTFTSEVGVVEPLCFTGGYTYYDITWMFSSSPTAYTALSFSLANSVGDVLLTGYSGRTAILGDTYSQTPWTTTALVAYCFNRNWMTYKITISHPNTARAKVISGTNNGSANGTTFLNCPHIMTGQNTTTTAYPSMYWSVVGTAVNGTISITGRNT